MIKRHKFVDLYEMSSGISTKPVQAGHGSPFVSFRTVFNNHFLPEELPDLMHTSASEQKAYSVRKGDILLTRTSETIDELGMSCVALKDYPEATFSGFAKRLRPRQEGVVDERFIGFYLRSALFRKTMTNNAVMTLRASLNEDIFSYLDLLLPDYKTQQRIGELLYGLHQKIALNTRINAELEALAKLVYGYWFVQFDFPISAAQAKRMGKPALAGKPYKSSGGAMVHNQELKREVPEGWEVENLAECCDIIDCLHSKKSDLQFEDELSYLLQLENIKDDGLLDLSDKYYVTKDEYKTWTSRIEVRDDDIVITNAGRVGATAQVPAHVVTGIGRNITAIRPKSISPTYLFLAFRGEDLRRQILWNSDSGAFFKSLNVKGIKKLYVARPDGELEKKFEELVLPMRRMREQNQVQNQELTALRDWLLPLLMNGQVVVGSDTSISLSANDQKIGGAEDGNAGMAMAAEAAGRYGKKR